MATQTERRLTPDEYLACERAAEEKSEYVDGVLVAMGAATRSHILINVNITGELHRQLKGQTGELYNQDMRVRIAEGGMYAYPDVVAVCGGAEFEDDEFDVLLNPTLIVEVLPPPPRRTTVASRQHAIASVLPSRSTSSWRRTASASSATPATASTGFSPKPAVSMM